MIPAIDALSRLREGNRRFVAQTPSSDKLDRARRAQLVARQQPFAIVLGCSDSRMPVEIVFDQGPGDLFVIRVAGNVATPSQIGSVEFAAERFGTRLVVVLGHTHCGAVEATVEELVRTTANGSPNLRCIVDCIRPAVEPLLQTELRRQPEALMQAAVRANIRAAVSHLQHGSQILAQLIRHDGLQVVGAEYSLASGVVQFLDVQASE